MKEALAAAPALRKAVYEKGTPIYITVDTSLTGIGWVVNQEDGQNEGGTCEVHKEIYSREVVESTKSGRGERYKSWLWWKEWSWWHWKKRDKEPTSRVKVNLYRT